MPGSFGFILEAQHTPAVASCTPLVMVLDSQTQTISLIRQDQRGTQLFLAPDLGRV